MAIWKALNEFELYWYILIITPLLYAPIVLGKRGASEKVVHHVNSIRLLMDQASITLTHQRRIWLSLIEKYIVEIKPDPTKNVSLPDLFNKTMEEEAGDQRADGTKEKPPA
jgi:hypothetical protein